MVCGVVPGGSECIHRLFGGNSRLARPALHGEEAFNIPSVASW